MRETELRFQVPAARRARVDAAVAGRAPRRCVRLQAAYVDTPDGALAQAGLALRVRREGRAWVQTLKGPTEDGISRIEHNVPLRGASGVPNANPALHAGSAAGDALAAALGGGSLNDLQVIYRTDILRRTRVLRSRMGTVELAFDRGWISAGAARAEVCELEIELKSGSPLAVLDVARRWLPRHGLWLETRSKAERGDLLARAQARAAPGLAQAVVLAPEATTEQAWQVVLRSCTAQISVNASQVASGDFSVEHVHQLRIGLRRLRSALRLFDDVPNAAVLGEAAADCFQRLGAARDQAVLASEFGREIEAAWRGLGLDADPAAAETGPTPADPVAVLRDPATQRLLLDLLALSQTEPEPRPAGSEAPGRGAVRDRLVARLRRWQRSVAADSGRYAELDDAARHRLRKHVKRLRYALEFCASLFKPRELRRCLRPLLALQEKLGAINDAAVAQQAFAAACADGRGSPRAWFALGWLQGQREPLIARAQPMLKAFAKARPLRRKGARTVR